MRILVWCCSAVVGAAMLMLGLGLASLYDQTAKLPDGAEITGSGIYSR